MIRCEDCNWEGELEDCGGLYADGSFSDVVPCCPECGSIKLIEIDERLVPV